MSARKERRLGNDIADSDKLFSFFITLQPASYCKATKKTITNRTRSQRRSTGMTRKSGDAAKQSTGLSKM